MRQKIIAAAFLLAGLPCAHATIVGLNQIVSPDLQPEGALAVSVQAQDPAIGNRGEFQLEMGLTPWLEGAYFQGIKPGEGIFSAEASLMANGPHLISVGAINLSTRGYGPQPVAEYGYYGDKHHFIVGAIYSNHKGEVPLGYHYTFNDRLSLSIDYQTGSENYSTIGFTFLPIPSLQINPAIYIPNTRPRVLRAYIVFTWTTQMWSPRHAGN